MDPEKDEELKEGTVLTDVNDLTPVQESQSKLIVPEKGPIFKKQMVEGHEVHVGKFSIIRPCQSKGRRISGHAPIYEAKMLAEHASVFTDWPMYIDHMDEELAEEVMAVLQEKGRSLTKLGGRLLRTYWDPDVVFEDDAEYGYQKGGVVGEVIPQKVIREMLEEDPGAVHVSINAWPKGVRIGTASWNKGIKGALIEGIRPKPMGSVDFVFRGGAGGRPLSEEERRSAVSLLESAYASAADGNDDLKERQVKLSEMSDEQIAALTPEQLAEAIKASGNDSLAESILSSRSAPAVPAATGGITQADLDRALAEQRTAIVGEFQDSQLTEQDINDRAEEIVQERETLRTLETHAVREIAKLKESGLPEGFASEIRKNYVLYASGPSQGLVVTESELEEGATAEEVLTERIKSDCLTANKLIEAAGGTPRVTGLAPDGPDAGGEGKRVTEQKTVLKPGSLFGEFLRESGDLTGDPDKDQAKLGEMLSEGR